MLAGVLGYIGGLEFAEKQGTRLEVTFNGRSQPGGGVPSASLILFLSCIL